MAIKYNNDYDFIRGIEYRNTNILRCKHNNNIVYFENNENRWPNRSFNTSEGTYTNALIRSGKNFFALKASFNRAQYSKQFVLRYYYTIQYGAHTINVQIAVPTSGNASYSVNPNNGLPVQTIPVPFNNTFEFIIKAEFESYTCDYLKLIALTESDNDNGYTRLDFSDNVKLPFDGDFTLSFSQASVPADYYQTHNMTCYAAHFSS